MIDLLDQPIVLPDKPPGATYEQLQDAVDARFIEKLTQLCVGEIFKLICDLGNNCQSPATIPPFRR